jgi:hypothetical protein
MYEFVTHYSDEGKEIPLSFDDGCFYVDGKKVLTEQKVTLDRYVNAALIVGGLSTLGLFLIEIYKLFFNIC